MTPTDEQAQITSVTRSSPDSLMIYAYAGTGKTTSLSLAGDEIKVPALALAFNKSIKEELAKRFPPNFKVMTMNGLGFQALTRALPQVTNFKIEDKKLGKLVSAVARRSKVDLLAEDWDCLRQLVSKAMLAGVTPEGSGRPLLPDSPETWTGLANEVGIGEADTELMTELAHQVLVENIALVKQGVISFDDQVYYSTCIAGLFPLFPVMMVDEAQDLNSLQHQMLRLASRPDGRLIACGDPRQAIYAFRGADAESMPRLRGLRPTWTDLPLTLTFRCPKVIVARQQDHAPGFRAAETNRQGTFESLGGEALPDGWEWGDVERLVGDRQLAILCRNNAPLLKMAFKLLRRRVSVKMLGRDIGQGLIALSRRLFSDDGTGQSTMSVALTEWEEHEVSLGMANDNDSAVDSARDRAESLRAVMAFGEVEDAGRLRQALRALFERQEGQVTLSTIHKAKGLEWEAVLHLDPWRIPAKAAVAKAKLGNDAALRQEWNLKYVCETRTRDLLVEANMGEMV